MQHQTFEAFAYLFDLRSTPTKAVACIAVLPSCIVAVDSIIGNVVLSINVSSTFTDTPILVNRVCCF
jgi:hypothetical protein